MEVGEWSEMKRNIKFYCIRDRKRYKYSEMRRICGTCNTLRCNALAVADRRGYVYVGNPAGLMGLFSRWFDEEKD